MATDWWDKDQLSPYLKNCQKCSCKLTLQVLQMQGNPAGLLIAVIQWVTELKKEITAFWAQKDFMAPDLSSPGMISNNHKLGPTGVLSIHQVSSVMQDLALY